MHLSFACPGHGDVLTSITGTRVVLSTSRGSEVYTGAYPTYVGGDSTLSFIDEYGSFILVSPGEDQTCHLTGLP